MKLLCFVLKMIILICMIALVHMKADIRAVIEVGVIYLAMVIRETREGEE